MRASVVVDRGPSAVAGAANFSRCGRYRYALERQLDTDGQGVVLFVMLNPSTADASRNDPTIRRCIGFARRLGARRLLVGNLYAYRATLPRQLFATEDPVGPGNDRWLRRMARQADRIVVAWGAHGLPERVQRVGRLLAGVRCEPLLALGLTASGQPRHPLYLPGNAPLQPWPC